ncbi:precorrin-2 C(20)-methyltransferase [Sedimentitalea sp. JM2-8]|uniref:Precorrin-2 C(20)-methyltransferase n=1 Tax=Sedimentitalea xiamensis TaxID=3050037 RepID=A0ABT7FH81_9RHOB|nr:precorrin-2 C(20)-methyltransferase [Sedimentitalea xiamensis]MDK3074499.1 precorrin-2 C(20)-methyltransferase [Sedimentitalea xiamensis]
MSAGTIYGLGLGPGDPDLMTVRADRLLRGARHVAFFRKAGRKGKARQIVEGLILEGATEHPMNYPVTTEIPLGDPEYNRQLAAFYATNTEHLAALARAGEDVVVLCEGDPFFYGSFMHLYTRLCGQVPVEVVPAITGMSAAWTASAAPITWGDDVLTVLMGTLPEEDLAARMTTTDALVVMKIGRNFEKVCRALRRAGLYDRAWLVEYAAMPGQQVRRLAGADVANVPYFSIILVHGQGRRP